MTVDTTARNEPLGTSRQLIFVAVALLALTGLLASTFPPIYFHFAGGDPGDYVNIAARFAFEHESGSRFFPPELGEVGEDAIKKLQKTFTDLRYKSDPNNRNIGLMTPFVRVSRNNEIWIPHVTLTSKLMGVSFKWMSVGIGHHLNFGLLFVSSVILYLIVHELTRQTLTSFVTAALYLAIPSHIILAQYPMGEPVAGCLHLGLIYLYVRNRGESNLPALLLIPLMHSRSEFAIPFLLFCTWAGANRQRWPSTVLVLLVAFLVPTSLRQIDRFVPHFSTLFPTSGVAGLSFYLVGECAAVVFRALPARSKQKVAQLTRLLRNHRMQLIGWGLHFSAIFVLEWLRADYEPGMSGVLLTYHRYSTVRVLLESVGFVFVGAAIFGLLRRSPDLFSKLPPVLLLILAPQLYIFINSGASTANVNFWTRRFHTFVYPMLCIGVGYFFRELSARTNRFPKPARIAVILATFAVIVAANRDSFRAIPRDYLRPTHVAKFHDDASKFPKEAIVVLGSSSYSKAAQLPLRTFHGLWSFVVWNQEHLDEAVFILRLTKRPVLVETGVLPGANEGDSADKFVLEVRFNGEKHFRVLTFVHATG